MWCLLLSGSQGIRKGVWCEWVSLCIITIASHRDEWTNASSYVASLFHSMIGCVMRQVKLNLCICSTLWMEDTGKTGSWREIFVTCNEMGVSGSKICYQCGANLLLQKSGGRRKDSYFVISASGGSGTHPAAARILVIDAGKSENCRFLFAFHWTFWVRWKQTRNQHKCVTGGKMSWKRMWWTNCASVVSHSRTTMHSSSGCCFSGSPFLFSFTDSSDCWCFLFPKVKTRRKNALKCVTSFPCCICYAYEVRLTIFWSASFNRFFRSTLFKPIYRSLFTLHPSSQSWFSLALLFTSQSLTSLSLFDDSFRRSHCSFISYSFLHNSFSGSQCRWLRFELLCVYGFTTGTQVIPLFTYFARSYRLLPPEPFPKNHSGRIPLFCVSWMLIFHHRTVATLVVVCLLLQSTCVTKTRKQPLYNSRIYFARIVFANDSLSEWESHFNNSSFNSFFCRCCCCSFSFQFFVFFLLLFRVLRPGDFDVLLILLPDCLSLTVWVRFLLRFSFREGKNYSHWICEFNPSLFEAHTQHNISIWMLALLFCYSSLILAKKKK